MKNEEPHEQPCCILCGQVLSEREQDICKELAVRFDHQLLCFAHQRIFCGCPGVRGQPQNS